MGRITNFPLDAWLSRITQLFHLNCSKFSLASILVTEITMEIMCMCGLMKTEKLNLSLCLRYYKQGWTQKSLQSMILIFQIKCNPIQYSHLTPSPISSVSFQHLCLIWIGLWFVHTKRPIFHLSIQISNNIIGFW